MFRIMGKKEKRVEPAGEDGGDVNARAAKKSKPDVDASAKTKVSSVHRAWVSGDEAPAGLSQSGIAALPAGALCADQAALAVCQTRCCSIAL